MAQNFIKQGCIFITFDADDYVECYAFLEGHNTSGQVLEHSDLGIYFGGFKVIGA